MNDVTLNPASFSHAELPQNNKCGWNGYAVTVKYVEKIGWFTYDAYRQVKF